MTDPYQPPAEDLFQNVNDDVPPFYVVNERKFLILSVATAGFYELYWFFRHWKMQKVYLYDNTWPVMRAIFAVFFIYPLFKRMEGTRQDLGLREEWKPGTMALIYIVAALTNWVQGTKEPSISALLLSLGCMVLQIYVLFSAQRVANTLCGDPQGKTNETLTGLNYFWIVVGLLTWTAVIISLGVDY